MALASIIGIIVAMVWLSNKGKKYRAEQNRQYREDDDRLITTILPTINNDEIKKG